MQNRFKFRCWDKDRQKMFDCIQINITKGAHGSNSVKDNECSIHLMYQPHLILMQCTGLKDKNGRLIYEGDIVKAKTEPFIEEEWGMTEPYTHTYIGKIVFENFGFIADVVDLAKHTISLSCFETIEVIGNIYENPELPEIGKKERNNEID